MGKKINKYPPHTHTRNDNLMEASWIANSDNYFKAADTFGFPL